METFIGLLCFIWGVLCLILFFKVWGMCNNVSKILQITTRIVEGSSNEEFLSSKLSVGDIVYIKPKRKESVVVGVIDGQYECCSNNKNLYDGIFDRKDLIKK